MIIFSFRPTATMVVRKLQNRLLLFAESSSESISGLGRIGEFLDVVRATMMLVGMVLITTLPW